MLRSVLFTFVSVLLFCLPALAEVPAGVPAKKRALFEELESEIQKMKAGETDEAPCPAPDALRKPSPYPYLDHHGYFRFRSTGYHRLHLGTQSITNGVTTSAFAPPLTENLVNNEAGGDFTANQVGSSNSEDWIADANIRLRWSPALHLTPDLAVFVQFDMLDNLVLGSTPDFAGYERRADVPLAAFTDGQVPPSNGVNGWQDSVRVRQAYGEWVLPLLGTIQVGRMADHWGLGIMANDGQDPDADYGDFVDRLALLLPFEHVKFRLTYDWIFEGVTDASPDSLIGQAHDLDDADDVRQFTLAIFDRPLSDEERRARAHRLTVLHKPVFDWGLYTRFRAQNFDVSASSYDEYMAGDIGYGEVRLVPRDAWMVTPDLWLRFQMNPNADWHIRIEAEAAMVYGEIENALMVNAPSTAVELMQFGGVLQAEARWKELSFGLESGFATGDNTGGFGYSDGSQLSWQNASGATVVNNELTAFQFDRDFHTDLILYRHVIGGVTNSFYMKPWIAYDFLAGDEDALGMQLSTMYARAVEADGTPGQSPNLGVEIDFSLFFGQKNTFHMALDWGTLIPMRGLDRAETEAYPSKASKWAMLLRTRLIWQF